MQLELWGWGTFMQGVGAETPVPAEAAPRGCANLCPDLS